MLELWSDYILPPQTVRCKNLHGAPEMWLYENFALLQGPQARACEMLQSALRRDCLLQ